MSVVCFHVEVSARQGHASIDMTRGVIDKPARNGPRIMPEYFSRLRIQCEGVVRAGEVHDAIHHYRRRFEYAWGFGMKDPLRLQVANVLRSDLGKAAEALASVVAVVHWPIVFDLRR